MPSSRLQRNGYDLVELQHPDMDHPPVRPTLSSDTAQSTQVGDYDMKSFQSNSPLETPSTYPPLPSQSIPLNSNRHVRLPDEAMHRSQPSYDVEGARGYEGMPYNDHADRPPNSRNSSWDIMAGIKKFEHDYEEFDSRHASEAHLAFADGDLPKNRVSTLW